MLLQKKRRLLCPVLLIEFLPRRAIRKTKTGRSEKHSAYLKSPSGSRCKRAYCCTAPLTYEFLIPCAKFLCMNKKVAKKSSNNIFGKQQYVDYGKKAHHPRKLSAAREGHHNKKARQATGSQARRRAPFVASAPFSKVCFGLCLYISLRASHRRSPETVRRFVLGIHPRPQDRSAIAASAPSNCNSGKPYIANAHINLVPNVFKQ